MPENNNLCKIDEATLNKLATAITSKINREIDKLNITINGDTVNVDENRNFNITITADNPIKMADQYYLSDYFPNELQINAEAFNNHDLLINTLKTYCIRYFNDNNATIMKKPPELILGDLNWTLSSGGIYNCTTNITFKFLDNSTLVKENFLLTYMDYMSNMELNAVYIDGDSSSYIDTGIPANVNHVIEVTGKLLSTNNTTTIFVGAYVDNSNRYTLRFLPVSKSHQHMVPVNIQSSLNLDTWDLVDKSVLGIPDEFENHFDYIVLATEYYAQTVEGDTSGKYNIDLDLNLYNYFTYKQTKNTLFIEQNKGTTRVFVEDLYINNPNSINVEVLGNGYFVNDVEYKVYKNYTFTNTGTITDVGVNFILFNEQNRSNNRCIIKEVKISDNNSNIIKHFKPYRLDKQAYMVDIAGMTEEQISNMLENGISGVDNNRLYLPNNNGYLEEVIE